MATRPHTEPVVLDLVLPSVAGRQFIGFGWGTRREEPNHIMPIVCSGRVFTPGTRPQGSELLTVTTRTPGPWCVVISPGPLIRSTGRAVHGVCGFDLLRCPSEKQHRHFARSSFRERSHHGLASLEKSTGAIREHSKVLSMHRFS